MTRVFDDVPTFVAVVSAGSFAGAAKHLHQSRSAVGKAVARLEHRLGVRLFNRTTRSQSLTEEGQVFFERCQRAMTELSTGRAMIDAGHASVGGRLRVSMPTLFGRLHVAPLLRQLAYSHPELELELNFTDRYIDVIGQGYDLCVRTDSLPDVAGLMTKRIADKATLVCASPTYVAKNGEPTDLAALAGHERLGYTRDRRTQVWRFPSEHGRTTDIAPSPRFHMDDLGSLLDHTLEGFGIAWLPDWLVVDHLHAGRLVRLLPHVPSTTATIQVVWPETPYLARRVRAAIDALSSMGRGKKLDDGMPATTWMSGPSLESI